MKRYRVLLVSGVDTSMEVDAESAEEAKIKAEESVYVGLCHECAHRMNPPVEWEAVTAEEIR